MNWKDKLSLKNVLGFREHSKFNEKLTTIKGLKNNLLNSGTILDVGCGNNYYKLSSHFGSRYYGIDFKGYYLKDGIKHKNFSECDLNSNKLPFDDNSFDNVMCTDVLEHLHNPHQFIKELFRISSKNVIISLPNNWPQYYWDLLIGKEIFKKFGYGLFPKEQDPGHRHTFFFNFEHACEFLQANCAKNYQVSNINFIFEYGNDGLLSSFPYVSKIFNIFGKANANLISEKLNLNKFTSIILNIIVKVLFLIIYIPNVALTAIFYNFPKVRFYNLFCRQIWFYYKKNV